MPKQSVGARTRQATSNSFCLRGTKCGSHHNRRIPHGFLFSSAQPAAGRIPLYATTDLFSKIQELASPIYASLEGWGSSIKRVMLQPHSRRKLAPQLLPSASCPHLDHLLADSHESVVQFWIHHLCLLEPEDLLVAPGAELLLVFLQALNNLQLNSTAEKDLGRG